MNPRLPLNQPASLRPDLSFAWLLRLVASSLHIGLVLSLVSTSVSCNQEPCVDKSKPKLDECNASAESLQKEINSLKRQLAQAIANPGTLKVDPSVLMIDGKSIAVAKAGTAEGTLSQDQVVATLRKSKASLQPCYNRALKRDSSLHHRPIRLTLSMKVHPSGSARSISLSPNYESQMTECMKRAIARWQFPPFKGSPVGIESPVTFTPRR